MVVITRSERKFKKCRTQVINSYVSLSGKYFKNATNDQIIDGLNTFYNDYKNRRILVYDAVWIVVKGISGTDAKEIEQLTENFRKVATDY